MRQTLVRRRVSANQMVFVIVQFVRLFSHPRAGLVRPLCRSSLMGASDYFMINCLGWIKISFFILWARKDGERVARSLPMWERFFFLFVYNSYVINFVYGKGMHIHYVIDDRAREINKWHKMRWSLLFRLSAPFSTSSHWRLASMVSFHALLQIQSLEAINFIDAWYRYLFCLGYLSLLSWKDFELSLKNFLKVITN